MARQSERRDATRATLVNAARECFLRNGFEASSTDAILAAAGLSKGALYHYFSNKSDLLAAVFEEVLIEVTHNSQSAARPGATTREMLSETLKAWIRAVLAPEPKKIILQIGPAVLGLERARTLEAPIVVEPLRQAIGRAVENGGVRCDDVDLAARLLSAWVGELALTAMEQRRDEQGLLRLDPYVDQVVNALLKEG